MPVTKESSCLRSGLNCAMGVLAGTIIGDAMIRDCFHIDRRGRVMRSEISLKRATALIAVGSSVED